MTKELDIDTITRPHGLVPVNLETTAALVRHINLLREALEFYANENNYKQLYIASKGFSISETLIDNGQKARNALGTQIPGDR